MKYSKEDYYNRVQQNRRLAADPAVTRCTCPNAQCEWHGRCKECVALHRHYQDHIPACLHPFVNDKISALAQIGELTTTPKDVSIPEDYRAYVEARDREQEK